MARRASRHAAALGIPLDDAEIAHRAVAERLERFLIGGRVMRGDRLRDAVPFDNDGAFLLPGLVGHLRNAAGEKPGAAGGERGPGELGIGRDLGGVLDRTIDTDPVGFGHDGSGGWGW